MEIPRKKGAFPAPQVVPCCQLTLDPPVNVRFWYKADITSRPRISAFEGIGRHCESSDELVDLRVRALVGGIRDRSRPTAQQDSRRSFLTASNCGTAADRRSNACSRAPSIRSLPGPSSAPRRRSIPSRTSQCDARRTRPSSAAKTKRLLFTFTRIANHVAKPQGAEPLTAGNVGWKRWGPAGSQ
jgi:hypothetical protein